MLVAAAVGNGGRNAPPAHPAALNDVLGATAVSADGRIYWRASQGATVDFAVPGVELPTADGPGAVRLRSGTSYAVPYLVAQLSQSLFEGVLSRTDWLDGRNVPVADLGAPGRDPVFGWGLPQVRCAAAESAQGCCVCCSRCSVDAIRGAVASGPGSAAPSTLWRCRPPSNQVRRT